MRTLAALLCLTLAVLLFSADSAWADDNSEAQKEAQYEADAEEVALHHIPC